GWNRPAIQVSDVSLRQSLVCPMSVLLVLAAASSRSLKRAGEFLACQRSRNSRRRSPKHPPRQSFLNSHYRMARLTKLGALDKSFCINFFIIYGGNRCPKALEPFSKIANANCPVK